MYYAHLLLAITLLTRPAPLTGVADPAGLHKALAPSLRQIAMHWQILDHRELEDILKDSKHFAEDLDLLQKRLEEMNGAPAVLEGERLPDREVVSNYLTLNRSYHQELTDRLTLDRVHSEEIQAALQETDQLYHIWDTVRDARCKYYYVTVRRQALRDLRDLVGNTAFYSGELPPPLPVWRIPRVR
jgi:hypothetical protein